MASDINTYALEVAFSLQDKATPQLDAIGQRLDKIEQQITTIATKTLSNIQTITTQLNTTLTQMAQQYDKILQSSTAGVKPLKDSGNLTAETHKKLTEEANLIDQKILKPWIQITKVLEGKIKQLGDETKAIEKEREIVEKVGKEFGNWTKQIEESAKALFSYLRSLLNIRAAVSESISATEMFKNANYRLYGSQSELVGRANQIAMQYGIMRREAFEAIAVLGNMRVPNEMLEKLTENTVKFNRLSGASIQITGQWQKNLVAMGLSAADIERRMTHMAIAMRRFGLDTQDVTALMRTQQEQAQYLRNMFGDKTASEIQRAQIAVTAFARELGATPEVAQQAAAALGTIEPWRLQQLGAMAGIATAEMETAEGQTKAMAVASSNLAQQLRNTTDPLQRQTLLLQAQGQYGDQLGQAIFNLAQQQANSNSKVRDGAAAHELMGRALSGHIGQVDNLNGIYQESNQTITAQLGLLKNSFFAAIGAIWAKLEPAIILFLQWLNTLIYWIGQVITTIGAWLDKLGPVGTAIKYVAAIIMIAIVVFVVFNTVLGAFGIAARLAGGAGAAMGGMIQRVLEGLSRGLTALAVHQLTMLTLAVLLIAMGLGALFFAMGVAKIAEHGTAGIKALLGLTTAIIILAFGLAYAGKIATFAAVGLLAVAIVLLAAGVASLFLAYAVKIISDVGAGAIGTLILLGVTLTGLGLALVWLAALAAPVVPALFAIGAALVLVAVAAAIFALALVIAIDALTRLDVNLALSVLGFALVMIVAGAALIAAAVILAIAAASMLVAGVVLAVASAILFIGALLIFVGASLLIAGSSFIYTASLMLIVASALLIVGGILLILAAPVLAVAGIALIPAAIMLLIGGTLLLAAAVIVATAGIFILIGGIGVYIGGLLLNMGAPLLRSAAKPLFWAGVILLFTAPMLLAAAVVLAAIGIMLLIAGVGVLLGGLFLFIGAFLLISGSTMLLTSAAFLVIAGIALILAAPIIFIAALLLVPVGILLLVAGILLIVPAVLLAVVGMLLLVAGIGILLGGMMIRAGSWFLLGSGAMLMASAPGLLAGAVLLIPAAILLLIASVLLTAAAIPFLIGSVMLLAGAAIFFVGALLLSFGAVFFEVGAQTFFDLSGPFLVASMALAAAGVFFILGAILMLVGAVLMIPAAILLLVAGIMLLLLSGPIISASKKLLPAGERFKLIGEGFMAAGIGLSQGGSLMRSGLWTMRKAAKEAGAAAAELEKDLIPLVGVALIAQQVAMPIQMLGIAIFVGAIFLYFGAKWLKAATDALAGPVAALHDQAFWLSGAAEMMLAAGTRILAGVTKIIEASDMIFRTALGFYLLASIAKSIIGNAFDLIAASVFLERASNAISEPAKQLWASGQKINEAAKWLESASVAMAAAATRLVAASKNIIDSVIGYYWLYVIGLLVEHGGITMLAGIVYLTLAVKVLETITDKLYAQSLLIYHSASYLVIGSYFIWQAGWYLWQAGEYIGNAVSGFRLLRILAGMIEGGASSLHNAVAIFKLVTAKLATAVADLDKAATVLVPLAYKLYQASYHILFAAFMLVVAETVLGGVGSGFLVLYLISGLIAAATSGLVTNATALFTAAGLINKSAYSLSDGSTKISEASIAISTASNELVRAASSIVLADSLLVGVGRGFAVLPDLAITLDRASVGISAATTSLTTAVAGLSSVATTLDDLSSVTTSLTTAVADLSSVAPVLNDLASAADELMAAAVNFDNAVNMLIMAGINLAAIDANNFAIVNRISENISKSAADLSNAIIPFLESINNLGMSAGLLGATASMFSVTATQFTEPIGALVTALSLFIAAAAAFADAMAGLSIVLAEPLAVILSEFASGATSASLELFEALDAVLMRVESYSDHLVENAARIGHAFRNILPTMPLGMIGLNLIQAQSFTTTRTRDSADVFYERHQRSEDRQIQIEIRNKLNEIVGKLQQLDTTVKNVSGGTGSVPAAVAEIVTLLRDNLPQIARSQSPGLAHALSEWMR